MQNATLTNGLVCCFFTVGSVKFLQLPFSCYLLGRNWQCLGLKGRIWKNFENHWFRLLGYADLLHLFSFGLLELSVLRMCFWKSCNIFWLCLEPRETKNLYQSG